MFKKIKEKLKWIDPFTYVDNFILPKIDSASEKIQWFVFGASYFILLILAFFTMGFTALVFGLITLIYVYIFVFEKEEAVHWAVYMLSAFVFAFILYHFVLVFLLGTSAPLVIIYSGSMEPVLYRGDIVMLSSADNLELNEAVVDFDVRNLGIKDLGELAVVYENGAYRQSAIKIKGKEYLFDKNGPIVVYYSEMQNRDIIHRAVLKLKAPDGDYLITFGDNNPVIDQFCTENPTPESCISPNVISTEKLRGKYVIHVPFLGYVKLLFFDDVPWIASCAFNLWQDPGKMISCMGTSADNRFQFVRVNSFK